MPRSYPYVWVHVGLYEEGFDQGLEKGMEIVAKNLKDNNVPLEIIIKSTGLTKEQIGQL